MITIIQKASNVCAYCRVRKQRCDRSLPRCERCAAKNHDCDYTPPPQFTALEPEPLVRYHKTCGHADLSPHGATEFVQAVKACIEANPVLDPATDLVDIVSEILNSVGFNLSHALTAFGPCIQQWCPIFSEDQIFGSCEYVPKEPVHAQDGPQNPVLWMCLWLVMRQPCSPYENMGTSELYTALKQAHALSQSTTGPELVVLQLGMLIAVYEIGHGMRQQAFQTLASCTATLRLLELEAGRKQNSEIAKALEWIKTSVGMLDRQLSLSMITNCLPLNIPTGHQISKSLAQKLGPIIPPPPPRPHASSPRKVFIRTGALVTAGHAIEYIYNRQQGCDPEKSYDQVDEITNRCISMLVVKPESPEMFQCDAVPMTFCSHIILQQTHIQHLYDTLPNLHTSLELAPEYQKAMVALRFSRSMAWQMVRTATQVIKLEKPNLTTTLAGLCSVMRAGLAVLETRGFLDDDVIKAGEIEAYLRLLREFSARWTVGNEYLKKVEVLLGYV